VATGLRARGASLVHNVDRLLVGDRVAEVLHHCLELILRYFPVVILVKQVESIQVRAGSSHRGAALAAAAEAADAAAATCAERRQGALRGDAAGAG